MVVELDAGRSNQFPTVIWVDADKRGDAIILIFGSRVEGQGAALRVTLANCPRCRANSCERETPLETRLAG